MTEQELIELDDKWWDVAFNLEKALQLYCQCNDEERMFIDTKVELAKHEFSNKDPEEKETLREVILNHKLCQYQLFQQRKFQERKAEMMMLLGKSLKKDECDV